MNKYVIAGLLALGLSVSAFATESVPRDTLGNATDPRYAGTSTCMIGVSTGTAALLCATGSGVILQVIGSSVATTEYLTFRDSATANTSSAELLRYSQGSTITPVGNLILPRFKNGLSVNDSAVPGPGATGMWTIIYNKDVK